MWQAGIKYYDEAFHLKAVYKINVHTKSTLPYARVCVYCAKTKQIKVATVAIRE